MRHGQKQKELAPKFYRETHFSETRLARAHGCGIQNRRCIIWSFLMSFFGWHLSSIYEAAAALFNERTNLLYILEHVIWDLAVFWARRGAIWIKRARVCAGSRGGGLICGMRIYTLCSGVCGAGKEARGMRGETWRPRRGWSLEG